MSDADDRGYTYMYMDQIWTPNVRGWDSDPFDDFIILSSPLQGYFVPIKVLRLHFMCIGTK